MNKPLCFRKLLRKGFHPVLSNPVFYWGCLSLFLIALVAGLFFTSAGTPAPSSDFARQKEALEEALETARAEFDLLSADDDQGPARQKVLFFETALRFSLPVWNHDFFFESASEYALILREWEILCAHPSEENRARREYLEQEEKVLKAVLEEKSLSSYLAFWEERMTHEGKTEEEIQTFLEESALRLAASADAGLTPAENALLKEIHAIRESLTQKIHCYHPMKKGLPLTSADASSLEDLLTLKIFCLQNSLFDPVPANTQTLFFGERLSAFAIFLILFFFLFRVWKNEKDSPAETLLSLGICFLFLTLFSALALSLSTRFFAPQSILPTLFCRNGRILSLPFFPTLFLRLGLRALPCFLPLFLCLFLQKKSAKRAALLAPLLLSFVFLPLSHAVRLCLRQNAWLHVLPFVHLDLAGSFFPENPLVLPVSPVPLVSLVLFVFVLALLSFFYCRKKKRKTP